MSKSFTVEVNDSADNLTIASHLSVEVEEKLGTAESKSVSIFEANPVSWVTIQLYSSLIDRRFEKRLLRRLPPGPIKRSNENRAPH